MNGELTMHPAEHLTTLVEKLRNLSPERLSEVEDFVDSLSTGDQDRKLVQTASIVSETALNAVWDNPLDAEYDRL